jgi:hypothetical protein
VGADEDFNEWARKVGDEDWEWGRVKERIKRIETYHVEVPEEHRKFIDAKPAGMFVYEEREGKLTSD